MAEDICLLLAVPHAALVMQIDEVQAWDNRAQYEPRTSKKCINVVQWKRRGKGDGASFVYQKLQFAIQTVRPRVPRSPPRPLADVHFVSPVRYDRRV